MSSTAIRGAALVAAAVVLAAAILALGVNDLDPEAQAAIGSELAVTAAAPAAPAAAPSAPVSPPVAPPPAAEPPPSPAPATVEPPAAAPPAAAPPPAAADPVSEVRQPAEVVVLVANGTDVSGLATRLTQTIGAQGFNTRSPANAPDNLGSTIYYQTGYAADAEAVRVALNTDTELAPYPDPLPVVEDGVDLTTVNVLILVGNDALSQN